MRPAWTLGCVPKPSASTLRRDISPPPPPPPPLPLLPPLPPLPPLPLLCLPPLPPTPTEARDQLATLFLNEPCGVGVGVSVSSTACQGEPGWLHPLPASERSPGLRGTNLREGGGGASGVFYGAAGGLRPCTESRCEAHRVHVRARACTCMHMHAHAHIHMHKHTPQSCRTYGIRPRAVSTACRGTPGERVLTYPVIYIRGSRVAGGCAPRHPNPNPNPKP